MTFTSPELRSSVRSSVLSGERDNQVPSVSGAVDVRQVEASI